MITFPTIDIIIEFFLDVQYDGTKGVFWLHSQLEESVGVFVSRQRCIGRCLCTAHHKTAVRAQG